jgi:hypothetical protein
MLAVAMAVQRKHENLTIQKVCEILTNLELGVKDEFDDA